MPVDSAYVQSIWKKTEALVIVTQTLYPRIIRREKSWMCGYLCKKFLDLYAGFTIGLTMRPMMLPSCNRPYVMTVVVLNSRVYLIFCNYCRIPGWVSVLAISKGLINLQL